MKLLLTNDDGIDAPGLQSLQQAVEGKGIIVAPQAQQSRCGHQVTTNRPIQVQQRSTAAFAVDGTPADCVRLALKHLCPDAEYVLAGINAGGNLGADIYVSGTLAAVREAALQGLPGIAISQYYRPDQAIDWHRGARWTAEVLADLQQEPIQAGSFWNVNLPHLAPEAPDPDRIFCPLSREPLPTAYRFDGEFFHYIGEYAKRDRAPGTDVDICLSGHISISLLQL